MDPLAEKYPSWSPYNYVLNNPLGDTDPTGMCPESVCPQGEEAAKIYSQGAVVTNQYGSWTWTGTSWATNGGVIQAAAPPNTAAQVRDSGWLGRLLYSLGNTVSHWFQAATLTSPDDRVNLDRSVATRKEVQDAFVDGASLIVSGIGGVKTATTVAVETAEVAAEVVAAKGSTKLVDDVVVQFGKGEKQVYHAFRHTDALGLDRSLVQSTVQSHFKTVSSQVVAGKPFNQIIEIGGQRVQYTAFKLSDETFNIGRIHGVK